MEDTLRHRAITEEHHSNTTRFTDRVSHGTTESNRNSRTHDSVCPEDALTQVSYVHRATTPPAQTSLAPHDLFEKALGIQPPGENMPVSSVCGRQRILVLHRAADT